MFGRGKSHPASDGMDKPQPRQSWSFKKKLLLIVGIAIVVIALAVGLGVGLTRGGGGGDGGDGGNDDTSNDDDLPNEGPDRTETWRPNANASWQIILKYPIDLSSDQAINPDVEIYDLDLFDNSIDSFKYLQDAGKKVICYFSGGSWEDWRDDKDEWDEAALGKELDGWPDERWANLSDSSVRNVMKERIRLAWRKGCDGIDPDNIDAYQNDNGVGMTKEDSIDFMRFLADEAEKYHMSIGLKNAGDIISDVLDFIDYSVNEQCVEFSECETFAPFIEANKPVFHIEYPEGAPGDVSTQATNEICSRKGKSAGAEKFSTVIKKLVLDGWVEYCDGETYTTEVEGGNDS